MAAKVPDEGNQPIEKSRKPKDAPEDVEGAEEPGAGPWQVSVQGECEEGDRGDTVTYYSHKSKEK